MKFSEKWLREWIDPPMDTATLADQLTMSGFEVESVQSAQPNFDRVVVGKVVEAKQHPDADRLRHCKVDVGESELLDIVCGGPNVRTDLKVAVVLVGGHIAGHPIQKAKLRGVESHGMICSEKELGLSEESDGNIMELPTDAPIGTPISRYLNLEDNVIEIAITPNRGDCLSIRGVAREVAAINQMSLKEPTTSPSKPAINTDISIQVEAQNQCPRYTARIVRNINTNAQTPIWMREKLRRSGLRSIHPVVDVMNYVMLELGQPLHAFDLDKLQGNIQVRPAKAGETVTLIDGKTVNLAEGMLVVADQKAVQAIAGVMGASVSAVSPQTKNLLLESAFFTPGNITLTARKLGMQTDSLYRFERGVDYELPLLALERATELLLQIVGGEVSQVVEVCHQDWLPKSEPIVLRRPQIQRILGITIPDNLVKQLLSALGMKVIYEQDRWQVQGPSYRFDLRYEVDLIEELARLYGYSKIPETLMTIKNELPNISATQLPLSRLRRLLVDRSYHEIVNFSFVARELMALLNPEKIAIPLTNPITQDMSVMRTNLWPGLINVLRYNENRQVQRIRLFEIGMCFIPEEKDCQQVTHLAGLISGEAQDLQWGEKARSVDFYDVKGDLSALLALTREGSSYRFEAGKHPSLHPGQSAAVYQEDRLMGHVGALHPKIVNQLGLKATPYLFEVALSAVETRKTPRYEPISRFPSVRRDLAFLVDRGLPAADLEQVIKKAAGSLLNNVQIFDIYDGKGIESGKKSVALGLTFQDPSRTLVDDEINQIIDRVVKVLEQQFQAKLRS